MYILTIVHNSHLQFKLIAFFCFTRSEESAVKVETLVKAEASDEEEPGVLNLLDKLEDTTEALVTR